MPTYGYECKSCGHSFDIFQSMADEPLKTCPACGKEIRRLINGGAGVIFKGSGFYVTDKKGANSAGKSAPAKTENTPPAACPGCAASGGTGSCPKAANS